MPKFESLKRRFPHRSYSLSNPLLQFMEAQPLFYQSLKLANWRRFQVIPHIITSHTPASHSRTLDEIIGMWYLDKEGAGTQNNPFFKQDFVVNVGRLDSEFVSYTIGFPTSQYVKPITDFFRDYGAGGQYYHKGSRWEHHYIDLVNLPNNPVLRGWCLALKHQWQTNGRCSV